MLLRSILFLIGYSALLLLGSIRAEAGSNVQFWAAMTPFEMETLHPIDAARSGDADTLLALALIASGDVRDHRVFDPIQRRVHQFTRRLRPTIENQTSVYAKGNKLLSAMHAHFFGSGRTGGDAELIDGYDALQSKVSAIFRNGQFNCISSAILYMVLARYFDLQVEGVITAQHAFVQILTPNGQYIEVETTSKRGYGLVHNRTFYENGFTRFSLNRNLAVPSYKDYQNRRVVPPYRFIAENMNHQHTTPSRMNPSARQRLFEIMGYLDAETPGSQLIRLNAYHNAAVTLLNNRKTGQATTFAQVVEPILSHVKTRSWIHQVQNKTVQAIRESVGSNYTLLGHLFLAEKQFNRAEPAYTEALQWAQSQLLQNKARKGLYKAQAFNAFGNQDWQSAIALNQKLLALTQASEKKAIRQTRDNIAAAYWNWGNAAGEQHRWQEAATHYGAIAQWTQDKATRQKSLAAKAKADAMHHFNGQRWDQAIRYYKKALVYLSSKNQSHVYRNMGSAYINWGNAFFYQQQYGQALGKYEAALGVLSPAQQTIVYRNIAAAYQNMADPLIHDGKVSAAAALVQKSVKRFPNCAPCKEEVERLSQMVHSDHSK